MSDGAKRSFLEGDFDICCRLNEDTTQEPLSKKPRAELGASYLGS